MTLNEILPLAGAWPSSLLPGLIIFTLPESRIRLRSALNLLGALAKLALVGLLLFGRGRRRGIRLPPRRAARHRPGLQGRCAGAAVRHPVGGAVAVLTTLYAIGYLEGAPHRSRFFGFFSLCVTATMGVAMAGNLFTFFVFYELADARPPTRWSCIAAPSRPCARHTFTSPIRWPAARLLLIGIVWLYSLAGQAEFTHGGVAGGAWRPGMTRQLQAIFLLLIAGVGVKAALVPLHGWLPQAMVAPAPVSALLHAVAVVKAGAFGIVRVVVRSLWRRVRRNRSHLLLPLAVAASVTIIWGSLRALFQDDLKKRLAYSTVSQVSYIVLGVALFGPVGTIGGLVHLVHQGIMKITLFFCAGNYAETLGIHKVSEMDGVGPAHAVDHARLQHRRAWHDGRAAHRRRDQQSLADRRCERGRHGLGCVGAAGHRACSTPPISCRSSGAPGESRCPRPGRKSTSRARIGARRRGCC